MEEDEIKECIVLVRIKGSHGTGFFIEKNKILTCYHVIKDTLEEDIKIIFKEKEYSVKILDKKEDPEIDLVILKVEVNNDNLLKIDKAASQEDKFLTYGFANNEFTSIKRGAVPITFEYEGNEEHLMKFKNGQFEEGHSGSPIINLRTKSVCGVINASRNTDSGLGGYGISIEKLESFEEIIISKPIQVKPKTILFNNYKAKNEPYYIVRKEDKQFLDYLEINNIWIFGASGQGKTALVTRNLIQQNIEYIFCDLSTDTITTPNVIFERIIAVIKRQFKIKVSPTEENKIITIVELLAEVEAKEIVILIDEMSVVDPDLLILIAESFVKLVTYYANNTEEESLKFVISTRAKPQDIIMDKAKASDYFEYICCDTWDEYLESLFNSLSDALSLNITEKNKVFILDSSKSSPRIVKKILSKIFNSEDKTDKFIKNSVKLTLQESI